jgi:hypothetical protein
LVYRKLVGFVKERVEGGMDVFLLSHTHLLPDGEEDDKLIGVYATAAEAEMAKQRMIRQPGFRESPDGFTVAQYALGQDHWTEGFVATR